MRAHAAGLTTNMELKYNFTIEDYFAFFSHKDENRF
jgi:hypothetical protein